MASPAREAMAAKAPHVFVVCEPGVVLGPIGAGEEPRADETWYHLQLAHWPPIARGSWG